MFAHIMIESAPVVVVVVVVVLICIMSDILLECMNNNKDRSFRFYTLRLLSFCILVHGVLVLRMFVYL